MQPNTLHDSPSSRKLPGRFHSLRFLIATLAILLLAFGALVWSLQTLGVIGGVIYRLLPILSTAAALLLAIFQWLFPFPPVGIVDVDDGDSSPGKPSEHQELASVFVFNVALPDPTEFFGRRRERATLLDRTTKRESTSLVGPRRIGKTWLITYLRQVIEVQLGPSCVHGYVDASRTACSTISGFVYESLQALNVTYPKPPDQLSLVDLDDAIQRLIAANKIPVLCIDEFEGLSNHTAFPITFFKELRATALRGLCLVTASRSRIIDLIGDPGDTSGFFNVFETVPMGEFTPDEEREFITAKGDAAGFSAEERSTVLQYGKRVPVRLQCAGYMLQQDKQLRQSYGPGYYRPGETAYWTEFNTRLEEKLRGIGVSDSASHE